MSGYVNSEAESKVLAAVQELVTGKPGTWASMASVREMAGLIRADFDMAMISLSRARKVQMIPEENQKTITAAWQHAAIKVQGATFHLVQPY